MPRDYDPSEIPSVYNLQDIAPYRDEPGFEQVLFRGIDQMVGFSKISPEKPDSEPHTHPYEQLNMLVEGRLDFLVNGERVELEPYDTLVIPPEVPHTSRAVEGETATLVAFWPLREDRLEATTYQAEFPAL
ncbi:cupin domain-containing protein [Natrarchaeobaculum aegyptiacum]|uniref:Pectin degradation protein n=1 Tax=Natrarchaeobaculum aegyptiacum TaxID=745377 RepID=A0A2Z2HTI0_9EURY|nr:cupin domain-containing protein [Natrarchaeobaculum aegyptiacum]ARS89435.1 pectin degradation protein [Natrarchaeobaculum aegyptiacum]